MKRYLVLTFSLFYLIQPTRLHAQGVVDFGTKVSVSQSSFTIKDKTPVNSNGNLFYLDYVDGTSLHPSIGIFAKDSFVPNLTVEAELLYLQKGASKTYHSMVTTAENPDVLTEETNTVEISLNYLQFGLNLQPTIQLGQLDLYATIGPSIDYLVSVTNLPREGVKNVTLGYDLGIGTSLNRALHVPVFVEVKYSGDFSSVYSAAGKYWNSVILLNVGVSLM